jgi:hypothetical protein
MTTMEAVLFTACGACAQKDNEVQLKQIKNEGGGATHPTGWTGEH